MLDTILSSPDDFPPHLHRHLLQLYAIKHRRAPKTQTEQRRAVYEYLTRTQRDKTGALRIHLSVELESWLKGTDERVRGWGHVSRSAGIAYQFSRDLRKRFDLTVERDYKEFALYLALSVRSALRWPEAALGDDFKSVLWEPAPGINSPSKVGVTRALNYLRRKSPDSRRLDLNKVQDFSRLLVRVLSEIDEGNLPGYVLSPAQYDYLGTPVKMKNPTLRLTGLMHHLVVERGSIAEQELNRPEMALTVAREAPNIVKRLRMPERLREAHGIRPTAVTSAGSTRAPALQQVTVVGPLSHGSGLGAAARACGEAFKAAGVPVDVLNHVAGWGRTDEDEGSGVVQRVRGDINIIHFNPDVILENLSRCGLDQFEGCYNIGFAFWETSQASFAHRLGLDMLDEVWVSSEYCRAVFQQATRKPVVVVRTPIPKFEDLSWANRSCFGIPDDPFTFIFTFDGASRVTRKNPVAVVDAFQQAYPSDNGVQLVIKTQNTNQLSTADERAYADIRTRAKQDRRIMIIDESFSSNEVHGLISVCDCYVSLHRSEGFGFGMAEAMKLGVPVIATGYSGNEDFTTEANAYPVRYRLVPVPKQDFVFDEAGQEWADAEISHAAERMLEVRSDPQRGAKIQRARETMHELYDEVAVGEAYRARIEAIRAGALIEAGAVVAGAR